HFARSRSEIEIRGKIRPGSRRGKAVRRSRPRLGQRHRQLRPVGPNRLSDALREFASKRVSPYRYANQFTKRSDKMSNSITSMRAVRGISQSLCIVLLLLTCRALSAQNQEHRIRNIVL